MKPDGTFEDTTPDKTKRHCRALSSCALTCALPISRVARDRRSPPGVTGWCITGVRWVISYPENPFLCVFVLYDCLFAFPVHLSEPPTCLTPHIRYPLNLRASDQWGGKRQTVPPDVSISNCSMISSRAYDDMLFCRTVMRRERTFRRCRRSIFDRVPPPSEGPAAGPQGKPRGGPPGPARECIAPPGGLRGGGACMCSDDSD